MLPREQIAEIRRKASEGEEVVASEVSNNKTGVDKAVLDSERVELAQMGGSRLEEEEIVMQE